MTTVEKIELFGSGDRDTSFGVVTPDINIESKAEDMLKHLQKFARGQQDSFYAYFAAGSDDSDDRDNVNLHKLFKDKLGDFIDASKDPNILPDIDGYYQVKDEIGNILPTCILTLRTLYYADSPNIEENSKPNPEVCGYYYTAIIKN